MIVGFVRFLIFFGLLFNTCYLMVVNDKLTNIALELNIEVENTDLIGLVKKVANDLGEQIEEQRTKVRQSLEKKGIEERNNVLMHARGEVTTELESK